MDDSGGGNDETESVETNNWYKVKATWMLVAAGCGELIIVQYIKGKAKNILLCATPKQGKIGSTPVGPIMAQECKKSTRWAY